MISFVIIEYHSVEDVSDCVGSIIDSCGGIEKEIIVSSNSTYPETKQEELINKYREITWVFNAENGGFANGMNAGLKASSGEIVVIMNPDVRIKNDGLSGAIKYLVNHQDAGLLGPKIVDSTGLLQDTCRPFMSPYRFLFRIPQRLLKSKDVLLESNFDYERVQPVDWVIGAFMMVNREALERVGGLDEGYFLYVEDMDWCKRFWDQGCKVVYFPELVVQYKGDRKSTSTIIGKRFFSKYVYYHFRSYIRFLFKFGLNPSRPSIN